MTTISTERDVVTLINVFTVAPADQQRLLDLLVEATESVMKRLPGFVSANLHKSIDGTMVTNYAQWRSREDLEAMLQNAEAMAHMKGPDRSPRSSSRTCTRFRSLTLWIAEHKGRGDVEGRIRGFGFGGSDVRTRVMHTSMKCGIPVVYGSIRTERWCLWRSTMVRRWIPHALR